MTADPGLKRHSNGRAACNKESKHLRPADEILRPRSLFFQHFRDPAFSGIAGRIAGKPASRERLYGRRQIVATGAKGSKTFSEIFSKRVKSIGSVRETVGLPEAKKPGKDARPSR
jgi:hypothetical protein